MNDDDQTNQPDQVAAGQLPYSTPLPQISTDTADQDYQNNAVLQKQIVALPLEANDVDIIEKEWVVKLKQVVEHTTEDPFTQQSEISKIKADYMKKRYSKDVKVAEG